MFSQEFYYTVQGHLMSIRVLIDYGQGKCMEVLWGGLKFNPEDLTDSRFKAPQKSFPENKVNLRNQSDLYCVVINQPSMAGGSSLVTAAVKQDLTKLRQASEINQTPNSSGPSSFYSPFPLKGLISSAE